MSDRALPESESDLSYEFGAFHLNVRESTLLKDGAAVRIRPKIFDMLVTLVRGGGRVVSQDELMKNVWGETTVERANLAVSVNHLRKILGDGADENRYVETLPKRGYRFAAHVRVIVGDEEEFGGQAFARRDDKILSLAVLPFGTLDYDERATPNDGAAHLGLGIADALITKLSGTRLLDVRPTSRIASYVGTIGDPVSVGRELGVNVVLCGNVQRAGERVRVTAQLLDTSSDGRQSRDAPLWAETFDTEWTDIFEVQDSISEQVARALSIDLSGEQRARMRKRFTQDAEAYRLYAKGRYLWHKFDEDALRKAVECFERAIIIDPSYAAAHSGISTAYILLGLMVASEVRPSNRFLQAKQAAQRALELDPTLPDAHAAFGMSLMACDYEWGRAEDSLNHALELDSHSATTHVWLSFLLAAMGRTEESVEHAKVALANAPQSLYFSVTAGFVLYTARRYEESIAHCELMLAGVPHLPPALWGRSWCYTQQHRYAEAIESARLAVDVSGGHPYALLSLGHALAVGGRGAEAREILERLQTSADGEYISPYFVSFTHVGLGEHEAALECLWQAYRNRDFWALWLIDPRFDPLRREPRFVELKRQIGLS